MNDLSNFQPLSDSMKQRVKDSIKETQRLIDKESAYLPENRNENRITYLTNHLKMLERELEISESN